MRSTRALISASTRRRARLRGLATHEAGSGNESIRFSVGANYRLTREWGVGARFSAASLRGDAGSSPIVEKQQQNDVGLFVGYRF